MAAIQSTTPPGSPIVDAIPFTKYPQAEPTDHEIAEIFAQYPPSPEHETMEFFVKSCDDALQSFENGCESANTDNACLSNLLRDSRAAVDLLQSLISEQRQRHLALAEMYVRRNALVKQQWSKLVELSLLVDEGPNSQMRDQAAQVLALKQDLNRAEGYISTLVAEGNAEQRASEHRQKEAEVEITALKKDLRFATERLEASEKQNELLTNTLKANISSDKAIQAITGYADYASDEWWIMHNRLVEKEAVELQVVAYRKYLEDQMLSFDARAKKLTNDNTALRVELESSQWKLDLIEDTHAEALADKDQELRAITEQKNTLQATVDAYASASDEDRAGDWTWHPLKPHIDAMAAENEALKARAEELEQLEKWRCQWEVFELEDQWKPTDPMVVARGRGFADMLMVLDEMRTKRVEMEDRWDEERAELMTRIAELEQKVRNSGGEAVKDGSW